MALNAPVQGSAADIIKKAMIDLDQVLEPLQARMLLQIHDELVIETPPEEQERATRLLRDTMEHVAELRVPLKVDIASASNLADCKA